MSTRTRQTLSLKPLLPLRLVPIYAWLNDIASPKAIFCRRPPPWLTSLKWNLFYSSLLFQRPLLTPPGRMPSIETGPSGIIIIVTKLKNTIAGALRAKPLFAAALRDIVSRLRACPNDPTAYRRRQRDNAVRWQVRYAIYTLEFVRLGW